MRSILFRPEMIKAIVKGRKTQTRRLSGLKEINLNPDEWILVRRDQMIGIPPDTYILHNIKRTELDGEAIAKFIKPCYQYGEVVYVKEAIHRCNTDYASHEAARYFLQILGMKPQRVQEISYEDILSEGWDIKTSQPYTDRTAGEDARDWYKALWDSIYPKYPWELNPYIWVYSFIKLRENEKTRIGR